MKYAGGATFRFRRQGDRLVDVSVEPPPIEGGPGSDVEVILDFYIQEQELVCGRVRVSTVAIDEDQLEYTLGPKAPGINIDSALWRKIPIGGIAEDGIEHIRAVAEEMLRITPKDWLKDVVKAEPPRSKPGPKPSLTTEILAGVVAPAYKAGGRKPVEAVRLALDSSGYPPAGEAVTIDQARKAVRKARALGLIPGANRKPRGGQKR